MKFGLALAIALLSALIGALYQDKPYRLRGEGYPSDQAALDHRDSAYSNITWVVSPSDNYMQLRFYDRVEGGICLRPDWPELTALAAKDPRLAHLVPAALPTPAPAFSDWPHEWQPNPGSLPNTKYVNLFPLGVLVNQPLMDAARAHAAAAGAEAAEAWRFARPKILVVGLGSGIGLSVFAHHFPQASITVVDIDQVVIDMVLDHYPFLRWLSTQTTADGRPRLRLVARDARQFIRIDAAKEARAGAPYDLVVLDAYTSGSTIPSHLMTVEFFAQCKDALAAEGVLMANIIGSYQRGEATGNKHLVLGGALRSMRAAGLEQAHNFPVIIPYRDTAGAVVRDVTRNNLVLATRSTPLESRARPAVWDQLRAFTPFPELPLATYWSRQVYGVDGNHAMVTDLAPWEGLEAKADAAVRQAFAKKSNPPGFKHFALAESKDAAVIAAVARLVREQPRGPGQAPPHGWDDLRRASAVVQRQCDWVLHARESWTNAIIAARDTSQHGAAALVGPLERDRVAGAPVPAIIPDAPLFTDSRPNADIWNN